MIKGGTNMLRGSMLLAAGTLVLAVADSRGIAIDSIHLYQRTLAPLAGRAGARCRFVPSCSHYAEAAIEHDGLMRGGWKAVKRVARCGPWTPAGTRDEP
jgi:uncharacterized protein